MGKIIRLKDYQFAIVKYIFIFLFYFSLSSITPYQADDFRIINSIPLDVNRLINYQQIISNPDASRNQHVASYYGINTIRTN
jgi:hypothetical protein